MLSLSVSNRFTESQIAAAEAEIIWSTDTTVSMPNIAASELVAYATGEINEFKKVAAISDLLISHLTNNGFDIEAAEDAVMAMRIATKRERAELRNKALAKLRNEYKEPFRAPCFFCLC